jgi:hypothetical protein
VDLGARHRPGIQGCYSVHRSTRGLGISTTLYRHRMLDWACPPTKEYLVS